MAVFLACATARPRAAPPSWVAGPRGRLRVDAGGSGDAVPVLLVHGNGGNRASWAATLAHLQKSRRAASFDLAGMGESELPAGAEISVEGFAGDVAAVADALGYRRFVLVAHSYGGAVAAAYAGRHPERLSGLVFADCAGDLHRTAAGSLEPLRRGLRDDYPGFTRRWFEGILSGARPETRAAVLDALQKTRPDVFVGATEALYRFDMDSALSRYGGPRFSIASMLFDNPVAIHRTVPGTPVRRIEAASHWLMMDQPEAFDRELDGFLERISASGQNISSPGHV
ncbi:MAG: alpha/beta hydrolase [Acidobacteriota bacterium]|nr:alpha/beta hydrolase [Acidobacteriota bacterium]